MVQAGASRKGKISQEMVILGMGQDWKTGRDMASRNGGYRNQKDYNNVSPNECQG